MKVCGLSEGRDYMRVVTLLENKKNGKELVNRFGLSLYIETNNLKILFDIGPDETFLKNAEKLDIDISMVDILIISHGHNDHGGGLEAFVSKNKKAKIYIGEGAYEEHYYKLFKFFNLNVSLKYNLNIKDRIIVVKEYMKINEQVHIFSKVANKEIRPYGAYRLLKKNENKKLVNDDFNHEINLLLRINDKLYLFCGCAHNGITNIIDKAHEVLGHNLDVVFGGMHLMNIKKLNEKNREYLDKVVNKLKKYNIENYYTGHCTGKVALEYISKHMENVKEINTGSTIDFTYE